MTEKIDWKQELLDSEKFNKKQENPLKNGAKSLTDSWLLGALYIRWKKLQGIREQSSPDCSSDRRIEKDSHTRRDHNYRKIRN